MNNRKEISAPSNKNTVLPQYSFTPVPNNEEKSPEHTVNSNQATSRSRKKLYIWISFILLILMVLIVRYEKNDDVSSICVRRPFSLDPPYDDEFKVSLWSHWANVSCQHVHPFFVAFLNKVWTPSNYTQQTREVRDKWFEQINKTNVILDDQHDKLLIGISSRGLDFQRRHLVRSHQINPHKSSQYGITWRFVLFTPEEEYLNAIKVENQTYGDIIILNAFNDSREASRTYKPFEWFKYVEKNMKQYKYVAKLDTDCFVNVPILWRDYFNQTVMQLDYSIVALFIEQVGPLVWPMGAFEALSWKTMLLINRFYENVNITDEAEDLQIGWYLNDAQINFTRVDIPSELGYDFRPGCNPSWFTDIKYNAVRIHELKREEDYVMVANCFNSEGVDKKRVDMMRTLNWTREKN